MFAVNALFGLLAMWVLDKIGLKEGLRIGASFVVIGCIFRAVSTGLFLPHIQQFYITMFSQWIIACGQPFILFTPTKVAELWFPEYERLLATTIISLGTPIGFIIATLIIPLFVTETDEIPKLVIALQKLS
ncbi:hypothetical protein B4U79_02835 [Dinothrombium tinctorium]|uniref:Major facilitator superfamily (MFS) profile domain-containing protein n=1 Tax=Dinothrombium tinctorium TaxID=1965070 RepID=A0A3S4QZ26_9ACAR|nr:hypothetical protein B4U79_02835 [Dinothrombium tinctorium]